jgi:CRP-like cAMP-binding protein
MKTNWASFFWQAILPRKARKSKTRLDFLKATAFFEDFNSWELELAHSFLHERVFKANEPIFEKGQPGAALYFICKGSVSIEVVKENNQVKNLAEISEGSFFGELALLDDSPRSATARAIDDVVVLALPRSELERMLKERPLIAAPVYRSLAIMTGERLKSTIERIQKEQRNELKVVSNG